MFHFANAPMLRLLCLAVATGLLGGLTLLPPKNALASYLYGFSLFFGLVLPQWLDRVGPFMPTLRLYLGETLWRAVLPVSLLVLPTVPNAIIIATVSLAVCACIAASLALSVNPYSSQYQKAMTYSNVVMYIIVTSVVVFLITAYASVLLEYPGSGLVLKLLMCALLIQMLFLRYICWTQFDGNHSMCIGQSSVVWHNLLADEGLDVFWRYFKDYAKNYPTLMTELTPYALQTLSFDRLLSYFDWTSRSNPNPSVPNYTDQYVIDAINARDKNVAFIWALHYPNYRNAVFDIRALRANKVPIVSETFALPE